ncbi:MAG TPA: GDP-mannose 4,6-dehydratase [Kofleriaceae bacterium]|jgi:GDPmannose 4,6-dehydratase
MSKRALITGIAGQDGAYLAKLLLEKGYRVVGGFRRGGWSEFWRLREMKIENDVELRPFELMEYSNVQRTLEKERPDEVYNLAAQSFVGLSFDQPIHTTTTNAIGTLHVLEAIRMVNKEIRFYQASSSEMFGKVTDALQSELTRFHPRSPYGVAKLFAHWATVNYREAHGLHGTNGILFNHESPLRGQEFVTRKITLGLARISLGLQQELVLGNVKACRDWGFAGDYVDAMWRMLQQPQGDDFVVATGQTHSVEEFVDAGARVAGVPLEWRGELADREAIDTRTGAVVVRVDPQLFRPAEVDTVRGDASKARRLLGWEPTVAFPELVALMMEADLRRARAGVDL